MTVPTCPKCGKPLGNGANAAFNRNRPLMACNCGFDPSTTNRSTDRRDGAGAEWLSEEGESSSDEAGAIAD